MQDRLVSFIESLKADGRVVFFDEATTKQGVIAKILTLLGWDFFDIDEVKPEYSVGAKRVDYSLRIDGSNKVFIEVKKTGEELDKHQEQLLNYSFQQGVKLAVLTNGVTWWLYLPLHEASWEQRKFYTIDIIQQASDDAAAKFADFLSRDKIVTGVAIQNAEITYRGQQKLSILRQTFPKAWNMLIEEANELLIELINETSEKICGFKADNELIEQFLANYKNRLIISDLTTRISILDRSQRSKDNISSKRTRDTATAPTLRKSYTGKSISSFYFSGSRYEVRSWKGMLIKLCDIMYSRHKAEFDKVLGIVGTKRPLFTKEKNKLRNPEMFKDTGIYVETNVSSNQVVSICFQVLALFGYASSDLIIEEF
jgi:predicted type IV restriction endonuclease